VKHSVQEYSKLFLEHLKRNRGYSDATVTTYATALKEAIGVIEIEENGEQSVWNLMPYRMKIASLKQKTIAKKLGALHSFVTYLGEEQKEKITLKADESVKVPKTLPKPVAYEHIAEALRYADERETLIIMLFYTLGLRISELRDLELVNITPQWVRVMGKGSKQRDIPLLPEVQEKLQAYLQVHSSKKYLFEQDSERLSENSLRYIVTKVFDRVALKVTPHQLRHSYATDLLNNGARIADVSELLGHSSMATTQIYTKLGNAAKMKNYKSAHPLGKETDDI
jgi:integrase/recombinase XerC